MIVVDYMKKKIFFNNLNPKIVSYNKLFWITVRPLFSNIVIYNVNIKPTEKDGIAQGDEKVAETIKWFFRKCFF